MALSRTFYQPANRFLSTTPNAITGIAWSAGDKIVVVGATNNVTVTLSAPTNANLTFGAADTEQSTGSSESNIYLWTTTAASSQTGQTINLNRSSGAGVFGGAVWVISGGPSGTANITSNRTEAGFSLNVGAGSIVIVAGVDWNAVAAGRTPLTGSGTITEQQDESDGTNYSIESIDWVNTSAGTFTFGHDYTGWKCSQVAIEILDAAGTVPDAPTGVTASADDTTVRVDWTPGADGGSPITDYTIEYAPGPGYSAWSTFTDGTSTATFITVTGLTNGTSYKFRVTATNAIGDSTASTASAAATPAAPPGGFADYGWHTAQLWTGRDLLESGQLPWAAGDLGITGGGGGGPVDFTVAYTEADDTWAVAAAETFAAGAAWTEADDTWAVSAAETFATGAAWTEDDDAWAVAAAEAITNLIAYTEADDTWAVSAAETFATGAAWTEDDDTWVVAVSNVAAGDCTIAWTEDDDSWVVAAAESIAASAAWTEDDDTWSTSAAESITASAAWTEADDTWAGTVGIAIPTTIAVGEDDDTWSAATEQTVTSAASWTEADDLWVVALAAADLAAGPTIPGLPVVWREPTVVVYAEPGATDGREPATVAGLEPSTHTWSEPATARGGTQ